MYIDYLKAIFTKENMKNYIFRNKNYIIITTMFFLISILAGYFLGNIFREMLIESLKNIAKDVSNDSAILMQNILMNNLRVALIITVSGFLFSILSFLILFTNGMVIGFLFKFLPASMILIYVIPHGIFELPAIILSAVCALLITKVEINLIRGLLQNDKTVLGEIRNSSTIISDIILTVCIIVVLLVIASIIEAYITPVLGDHLVQMLNIRI